MLANAAWLAAEAAAVVLAVLVLSLVASVVNPSAGAAAAAAAEDDGLSPEARAIRKKYLEAKARQEGTPDAPGAGAVAAPTAAETQAKAAAKVRHLARKHRRDCPDDATLRTRQVLCAGGLAACAGGV